ncbi:MAG: hypothetical protein MZV63_55610 [Marinilabiliales bacterium]|nr:hypothetical protein [Marinilabiliales bacterium]
MWVISHAMIPVKGGTDAYPAAGCAPSEEQQQFVPVEPKGVVKRKVDRDADDRNGADPEV